LATALEGEAQTGPDDTVIVVLAVHDIPTEVVHDAYVRGDANLETAAEFSHAFDITVPRHADEVVSSIDEIFRARTIE